MILRFFDVFNKKFPQGKILEKFKTMQSLYETKRYPDAKLEFYKLCPNQIIDF
jgi:hypothetical protein